MLQVASHDRTERRSRFGVSDDEHVDVGPLDRLEDARVRIESEPVERNDVRRRLGQGAQAGGDVRIRQAIEQTNIDVDPAQTQPRGEKIADRLCLVGRRGVDERADVVPPMNQLCRFALVFAGALFETFVRRTRQRHPALRGSGRRRSQAQRIDEARERSRFLERRSLGALRRFVESRGVLELRLGLEFARVLELRRWVVLARDGDGRGVGARPGAARWGGAFA